MSKLGEFLKKLGKIIAANKAKSIIIGCVAAVAIGGTTTAIILTNSHDHTPLTAITENYISATCTTDGSYDEVVYCGDCDEEIERKTIKIDMYGHTEVIDNTIPPTCTATGLTEGKHCSVCNDIIIPQEIIPAAHTIVIDEAVPHTCTETGLTEGKHCSACDEILVKQEIVPANHSLVIDIAVAPTCTQNGLTAGEHCTECDYVLIEQSTIEALGHTKVDDFAIESTCTSTGLTSGVHCSVCNEVFVAQEIIPLKPHTEVIDHATEATCTATGLTEGKHCSVCDGIIVAQQTVPLKPHTEVVDIAISATCTETGLTEGKHCSVCNEILIAQNTTDIINHIESDWITDSTSSIRTEGMKHTECTMCGLKINEEITPASFSSGFAYTVNSDGTTCTITGLGTCSDTEIGIPETIDGYTVTVIGEKAFAENDSITFIKLPGTVISIQNRAFYKCTEITEITIPESVTEIGTQIFYKAENLNTVYYNSPYNADNAFLNLSHIEKIVLGGSTLNNKAVQNLSHLKYLEISGSFSAIPAGNKYLGYVGSTLTTIKDSLFVGCDNIITISIGDSVTTIGEYAFYGLSNLTTLIIGNGVKQIGTEAFSGCTNLSNITLSNNLTKIGAKAFYACSNLTDIALPATLTDVGEDAFYECSNISKVYITDLAKWCKISFASYGSNPLYYADELFLNNEAISELVIPNEVTNIGSYTFVNCPNITRVNIPSNVLSIGKGAFYSANIDELHIDDLSKWCYITFEDEYANPSRYAEKIYHNGAPITEIVIPKDLTTINNYAYISFKDLVSLTIPDNIESIGNFAFSNCTGIVSLTIPDSVTSIGERAFYSCTSLTNLTIPDSVTKITDYTFYNCSGLTSVTIPDSITSIDTHAFVDCYKLVEVINHSSLDITVGSSGNGYVAYYAKEVHTGESKIVNHNDYLFYTYDNVNYLVGYVEDDTELVLPDDYNGEEYAIYNYAFYNRSNLTSITISESITQIGKHTFSECTSLEEVYFNATKMDDLTSGDNVFSNAGINGDGIKVVIGKNVTKIPAYLFNAPSSYSPKITSVEFEEGSVCTSIGHLAFSYCTSLVSVIIHDSVTNIGNYAFSRCSSLTSLTIGNGVTTIGDGAFYKCTALEEIYFNATEMNDLSFDENALITRNYVFYDAGINGNGIKVVIGKNVTKIPAYLFNPHTYQSYSNGYETVSPPKITSVEFEEGSVCTSIGSYAFRGCSELTGVYIADIEAWCNISFGNDYSNPLYYADNLYINGELITELVIPDGVTTIKDSAFKNFISLVSVTIGNSVTTIGEDAFYGCSSLASVAIGNGVKSIGNDAFYGCRMLLEVINHSSLNITAGSSSNGYVAYYAIEVHTDESKMVHYNDYLFYNYNNINYLVGYIGEDIELILPENYNGEVYKIHKQAFRSYSNLINVTIGNGVTSIGERAFYGCSSLKSITIPDSVASIGEDAFSGCTSLKGVYITNIAKWCAISFSGVNSNPLHYAHDLYLNGEVITELVIPKSVTSIADNAFHYCKSLTSLTIPSSVTSIGRSAFDQCEKLTSITILGGSTIIDYWAFEDCNNLEYVYITDIAKWCSITFKTATSNPLYYAGNLYLNSELITELVIPEDVTSISNYAFYNCDGLTSVTILSGVTNIGYNAFYKCDNLTQAKFKKTNGWWYAQNSTTTYGTTIYNLTDTSKAATYLTKTYANYYWKR